jgi:drug/metabolite transporter (DMT)-like permease
MTGAQARPTVGAMSTHTLSTPASTPGWSWLLAPTTGLVAATLFWSGNFVVGRALRGEIEPIALNFWRWLIAAAVLAPFVWKGFRAQWPLLRDHPRYVFLLGLTGLAVPHACSYQAVQTTSAVNALLILILMPAFVAIGAWRFLGHPVARTQWAGIALAMGGAASILVRWDLDALLQLRLHPGDLWMIPAVLCSSIHTVLLKKTPAGVTQGPLLFASMLAALLLMAPAVAWMGVGRLAAITEVWLGALYVGVFASAAAFFLWNRGVVRVGPARAAPLMYLMPLYASVLSALFIGEGVQAYQLAGGALVLLGVWLARAR